MKSNTMAEFQDYTQWIEAYFDHSIIEVERKSLEEQANKDIDLAKKIRLQGESLLAYELLGKQYWRDNLHEMYKEVKVERKRSQQTLVKSGGLLMAVVTVAVLAFFFMPSLPVSVGANDNPEVQAISIADSEIPEDSGPDFALMANDYFEPIPVELKVTRNARINSLSQRVAVSFQNGLYEQAIRGYETLLEADSTRTDALLGKGISHLALGEAQQAARYLAEVIYQDKTYAEEARWYMGLAYFHEGMMIQAIGIMEEISHNEGHFKQQEAKDILQEIR